MKLPFFAKRDPDTDLVARASRGDRRAFNELVVRHHTRLIAFVRSRTDSAIDAEDIAQDVFLIAWRELPGFRGGSSFQTWLFGIALNRCARAFRQYQKAREMVGDWPADEPVDPSTTEDVTAAFLQGVDIRRLVTELPENERDVIELYYFADLNLREISDTLGVNLNTVKYRFYRAQRALESGLTQVETPRKAVRCG